MTGSQPHDMGELFMLGEQQVSAPRDAARAVGLVGLLSLLVTVVAVVAAVVVTVGFFAVVLGSVWAIFAFDSPITT